MGDLSKYIISSVIFLLCMHFSSSRAQEFPSFHKLQSSLVDSKKDTVQLALLLEAGKLYLKTPNGKKANQDSATLFINRAWALSKELKQPLWEARCLLLYSKLFREKKQINKGRDALKKALAFFHKSAANPDLGDAYSEMMNYYDEYKDSDLENIIRCQEQAAQYYCRAGKKEDYAVALSSLGNLYLVIVEPNNAKVVDTLNRALTTYKEIKYKKLQYIYDLLGQQYSKIGDYKKSFSYYQEAVKIAESMNDSTFESIIVYFDAGMDYYNLRGFDKAYHYLEKSLSIALKYDNREQIIFVAQGLIGAYLVNNKTANALKLLKRMEAQLQIKGRGDWLPITGMALMCYMETTEKDKTQFYLQELLKFSRAHPRLDQSQLYVYNYLILYYLKLRQYKEAGKYCILNDSLNRKYSLTRNRINNYVWSCRVDSALGNFSSALEHYKKAGALSDSIYYGENRKQISELQIKYDTDKKESAIQLLSKRTELQAIELKQETFLQNISIGGVITLLVFLFLGYNRYQLKQLSNKKLKEKQNEINSKNETLHHLLEEKELLIKEVHHRVKNNLQIVMSLLNTQVAYLDSKEAVAVIQESQQRIQAITLIYKKLYQTNKRNSIHLKYYMDELIDYLKENVEGDKSIYFKLDLESFEMDVSQAIPLGLILNEAVVNTIKYAFTDRNSGTVSITLKRLKGSSVLLPVKDDGIGLPFQFDETKIHSFGMSLMKDLSNQLAGSFKLKKEKGLEVEIEFPNMSLA